MSPANNRLFAYGTLMDPSHLSALLQRHPGQGQPATLHGFRRYDTRLGYPAMLPGAPHDYVPGVLWTGIQPSDWPTLDQYEDCDAQPPAYFRRVVHVHVAEDQDPLATYTYIANPAWFAGQLMNSKNEDE